MAVRLDLSPVERAIVCAILRRHLPSGVRVWAFGSRAVGRARRLSDLDLAIDAGRALELGELAGLREAFAESDLPWRVDLLDWHGTDPAFRARIAGTLVPLAVADAT